ncbi:helix-turn-helix domain-containing protein [Roseibium album]|uniref:helix-turn-helix domain-containing protein n=1 Tax=Roseibium album TaxID=311410 RepID=UPI0039196734
MTIFDWLKQNNLTAKDFAKVARLSEAQVSRVLNGVSCTRWATAKGMSEATGGTFSTEDFLKMGAGETVVKGEFES